MDRKIWSLWIAGLTLKLVGASWDVSWHFRLLRESISPPHVINMVGFALISLAFLLSWRARTEATQPALNVILAGFAVFLAAIPFDEAWHRIFGIDLTTWSPSHLTLFYGTVITIAGIVLLFLAESGWRAGSTVREASLTRYHWGVLFVLLFFLFESLAFPLTYNEYTVLGAWNHAHANSLYAVGPEIQGYADMVADPSYGGLPHALYPAYAIGIALLFAVLIRQIVGIPGVALAVLSLFAVERFVANALLQVSAWPIGAVPWHVIAVGLAVEIAWLATPRLARRILVSVTGAVAGSYAYWYGAQGVLFVVPLDWSTLPYAGAAALVGAGLGVWISNRMAPMVDFVNVDPTPYAGRRAEAWLTAKR